MIEDPESADNYAPAPPQDPQRHYLPGTGAHQCLGCREAPYSMLGRNAKVEVCKPHRDAIFAMLDEHPTRQLFWDRTLRQFYWIDGVLELKDTGRPGDLDPTGALFAKIPQVSVDRPWMFGSRGMLVLLKLRSQYREARRSLYIDPDA